MKSLGIIAALLFTSQVFAQVSLGDIIGEVHDLKTGEPVYDAVVFTELSGAKYRARTDFDGRFRISGIQPGTYIVSVSYKGDTMTNFTAKVPIDAYADMGIIDFTSDVLTLTTAEAKADYGWIKLEHGNLPIREITAEDLAHSPARFDMKSMVASASSDVHLSEDGDLVFRGARKGDMLMLTDGMKSSEVGRLPGAAIGRMQIYAGGLPAKYGDTLGGVIVVETKSYFDLYNAWMAEQIRKEN